MVMSKRRRRVKPRWLNIAFIFGLTFALPGIGALFMMLRNPFASSALPSTAFLLHRSRRRKAVKHILGVVSDLAFRTSRAASMTSLIFMHELKASPMLRSARKNRVLPMSGADFGAFATRFWADCAARNVFC